MRKIHSAPLVLLFVAALSSLAFVGCGESDPKALTDAATEAIQVRDFKGGLANFDAALAHMDAANPQYMRASLGRCVALAHVDPAKGKEEFLKLAEALKAKLTPADVHFVVSAFVGARELEHATDIMERMKAMFPLSKEMQDIGNSVADAAIKAGDTKVQEKLRGLGYVGSAK
ncbi:MAG: hypothetical protein SGI72_07910 [Planctomycetota bacterium]|nr:hypothetical protein [Planctomycetota bacterium]